MTLRSTTSSRSSNESERISMHYTDPTDRANWRTSRRNVRSHRDASIVTRDVTTLRALYIGSALFAIATMETASAIAERNFANVANGADTRTLHRYANGKAPTIAALYAYIGSQDVAFFDRDDYAIVTDIVANVPGLGPVKASFTVTLAGGNVPCVDRHGAREYIRKATNAAERIIGSEDAIMNTWKGRKPRKNETMHDVAADRIAKYRIVADVAFGTADAQWAFFEDADPNFAAHGHATFFESLATFVARYVAANS